MTAEQQPNPKRRKPINQMSLAEVRRRWPRVTAHLIAESLGYATPDKAAFIIKDALLGEPNYSEWVLACYQGDASKPLRAAIRNRHYHTGFMADYRQALAIVRAVNQGEPGPIFASWF
jgi:hypothetical protein